jgi:hypothetical protein
MTLGQVLIAAVVGGFCLVVLAYAVGVVMAAIRSRRCRGAGEYSGPVATRARGMRR